MPACMERCTSSSKAFAVRAMTGILSSSDEMVFYTIHAGFSSVSPWFRKTSWFSISNIRSASIPTHAYFSSLFRLM